MRNILLITLLLFSTVTFAQNFKFAVISDMHVNPLNAEPMEDLKKAIEDINKTEEIQFVLVLGDITEQGDKASLEAAKAELDKLSMKYYAISGNHETKWSSSGATAFSEVFGSERFDFEHEGIRFLGFATGPIVRMMDGHIDVEDIFWLNQELSKKPNQPAIVATHYPLTMQDVDNWYEATDALRQYNVKLILSGHHHKNVKTAYDGIPALINKSTLRDKYDELTAYNIYTVTDTKVSVAERKVDPLLRPLTWAEFALNTQYYTKDARKFKRPNYSVNNQFPKIKIIWSRNIYQTVYTSPAMNSNKIFFGDDNGIFYAFDANKDNEIWRYKSGGRIIGTAAANEKVVVFGSTDKTIYGLDANSGNVLWQHLAGEAVLGSATIDGNTVYIGASDGSFYAFDVNTGSIKWQYTGIEGYIECKPLVHNDKVIFGAWDQHLYALNKNDGTLAWKWKGGQEGMHFSPAAVWPVASKDKIFIVAPDRNMTAINVNTGETIWRTSESQVRESIGISEDKQRVYAKTMQDNVVCYSANSDTPELLWTANVGYGYDHAASMLVEKGGTVFGSTKNGVIFAIHAKTGELLWKHKLSNTLIGTVIPINGNRCVYVTSQGTIGMLEGRKN